jgi:hypothetical protein
MGGEHIGPPEGGDDALADPSSDAPAFDHVEVLIGLGALTAGDGPHKRFARDVRRIMHQFLHNVVMNARDIFTTLLRAPDARLLQNPGKSRGCE